jgi:hypothetical protein
MGSMHSTLRTSLRTSKGCGTRLGISDQAGGGPWSCTNKEEQDLLFVVDVALRKKERHRDIAIGQAATLQIGRIGTAMYRAGRAIHKSRTGTKGVSRDQAANILLEYAPQQTLAGEYARRIVAVLAKKNFDELLKASIKESLRS